MITIKPIGWPKWRYIDVKDYEDCDKIWLEAISPSKLTIYILHEQNQKHVNHTKFTTSAVRTLLPPLAWDSHEREGTLTVHRVVGCTGSTRHVHPVTVTDVLLEHRVAQSRPLVTRCNIKDIHIMMLLKYYWILF